MKDGFEDFLEFENSYRIFAVGGTHFSLTEV